MAFCLMGCSEFNLFDESVDQIPGIDYPITEEGEGYTVTYKFNESTIVYDEVSINYVHHIENDTILFFATNTPSELLPGVGSIISAPITDVTPFGLGNKVLSVTTSGDYLKMVTTSAPLDEIFDKLSFVYETEDFSCLADQMEVYDIENDQWTKLISQPQDSRYDWDTEPISMKFPSLRKHGMTLKGDVQLKGKLHAEGDIDNGTFDFYFEPAITFNASAGAELEYKKKLLKKESPLYKSPKVSLSPIAVGPLILHPYISVNASLDFNASGSVLLDFEQRCSIKGGYSQICGSYLKNTSSDVSDFIKDVSVNGNIRFKMKWLFNVGIGVYVKNVAAEVTPYFTIGLGTDFRTETLKNNNQSLDARLNFDVNTGMDARFVVELWGKLRLAPEVNVADFSIFHYDWPLIPVYEKGSLLVAKGSTHGTYDGNFIVTGAPLAKFWPITPSVKVYDKNHKLYEEVRLDGPILCTSDYFVRFNITGLRESDYYVRPCLNYRCKDGSEICCEAEDEYQICHNVQVQIKDIRQKGWRNSEHECSDNCGAHFFLAFDYDVDIEILGSANCVEYGYCVCYIHDNWKYYSGLHKDGVNTISNSVSVQTEDPRFTIYPYIKYEDGTVEIGDPYTTEFSTSRSNKTKSKSKKNYVGDLEMASPIP